jgi:MYXO-CTERM domain-containing protein
MWGGPPARLALAAGAGAPTSAKRLGLAPRDASLQLAAFVKGPLPPESMLSTGGATPVLSYPPPNMAVADAGGDLGAVVAEAGAVDTGGDAGPPPPLPPTAPPSGGCAGCSSTQGNATTGGAIAALLGIALTRLRRRRG